MAAPGVATVNTEEVEVETPLDTEVPVCLFPNFAVTAVTKTHNNKNFMLAKYTIRQHSTQNIQKSKRGHPRSQQAGHLVYLWNTAWRRFSSSFQRSSGTLLHMPHVGIGLVLAFGKS